MKKLATLLATSAVALVASGRFATAYAQDDGRLPARRGFGVAAELLRRRTMATSSRTPSRAPTVRPQLLRRGRYRVRICEGGSASATLTAPGTEGSFTVTGEGKTSGVTESSVHRPYSRGPARRKAGPSQARNGSRHVVGDAAVGNPRRWGRAAALGQEEVASSTPRRCPA